MYENIENLYGDIFENLTKELEKSVKKLCIPHAYTKDQVIFEDGDVADYLYIVVSGLVELTYTLPLKDDSMSVSIAKVNTGKAFGWSALSKNHHYSLKATAREDTETLRIAGSDLSELMEQNPELGYAVMKRIVNIVDARLQSTRNELRWLLSSC